MKLITLYLLACFMMGQPTVTDRQPLPDENPVLTIEQDDLPKSTAIFWVDKKYRKKEEPLRVQSVKAKVIISKEGNVKLLSFVNTQSPTLDKYLREHLKEFKVTRKMFEGGYIKPGEQYVHLRYMPDKVR